MDHAACNVIYVNHNVGEERLVRRLTPNSAVTRDLDAPEWKQDHVRDDVQPLLDAFGDVYVCATGPACILRLMQLQDGTVTDLRPTLVLLDTPHDEPLPAPRSPSRSASPFSKSQPNTAEIHTPDENIYGLDLLQKLITEAHLRGLSKLLVPIPIISFAQADPVDRPPPMTDGTVEPFNAPLHSLAANRRLVRRCLDLGAADVIISPLSSKCITTLEICAYKAHKDASREHQALLEIQKGRKRSWVGVNEQKPFAYLREAMVSGLMNGICRVASEDDGIASAHIAVSSERQAAIAEAVGHWHFCAHSFTDDELLVAAMLMFKHALTMPELEAWRIPPDRLISFLVACRAAYNSFVPYHNFRHVVDVLQATFNFLTHVGALHPYASSDKSVAEAEKSPIASLLRPFEALTLLITAIGHDVGHPGVNNGFLATLNAPLAQLYNDRSVLESFHCAAYSQILRRYWPAAFDDRGMRSLMISSILATDMGLHFDYMKKLGDTQEKLQHRNSVDGWNGRQLDEQRSLACSLLIKCADISNVARRHDTAQQWMHILSEEFSRQAYMEEELQIKSSLFAAPKKDIISLSHAQLGFMNMFAIPLFQGVADIMPGMKYTVDELELNKGLFEQKIRDEKARQASEGVDTPSQVKREGTLSPRSRSFTNEGQGSDGQDWSQTETPRNVTEDSKAAEGFQESMASSQATVLPENEKMLLRTSGQSAPPRSRPHTPSNAVDGPASFDAVRDFAESDPFNNHSQGTGSIEAKLTPLSGQRCSETTDGSTSGAGAGDWTSQAPSAATGKMPLSPSTQGTSIVSEGSIAERPVSSAAGVSASPASAKGSPSTLRDKQGSSQRDEESVASATGSIGKTEGKSLKKRPSRFRMKDLKDLKEFSFFRRNKTYNSSYPAADTASS